MPKINQQEYEILQFLNNTKDWVVRNPDGQLWAIEGEAPRKSPFYETWKEGDGQDVSKVDVSSFLFQFIQWEDESPYNIQELIEEYLYDNQPKLFIDGQEQSFEFIEESEEKEVKDLEWVKAKLKKDHKDGEMARSQIKDGEKIDGIDLNSYWRGRQTANYIARCYLEDLDEPETLSQKWIDKHSYNVHLLGTPDVETVAIPRDDLQNLLVPKQEKVKIESVWAEDIEEAKASGMTLFKAMNWMAIDSDEKEKQDLFARAWLDGYTVEEKQKYYVIFKQEDTCTVTLNKNGGIGTIFRTGSEIPKSYQLTEQEIKDYDERYWLFAVKVEELEE